MMQSNGVRPNWDTVYTLSGATVTTVMSSAIDALRGGNALPASKFALELQSCSTAVEATLWDRYALFAIEDVGTTEPNAILIVRALRQSAAELPVSSPSRGMYAVHCAVYLADLKKSRMTPAFFTHAEDHVLRLLEKKNRDKKAASNA